METQRVSTDQSFSALPTGTVLDRYRIDQIIAAGGFGITYLCHHITLGKPYALKEHFPRQLAYREGSTSNVRSTDPGTFTWALDRFIQEGRSLATCSHPNVVNVADVFEANSTAYMVLAYEQGQSLKSWMEELKRPLNQAEIDKILAPLLDALEYVHSKGLLHRDIAPDNIIIRPDETPCLIDFGAARQAVAERSQIMSAVVKSGFSPPEQYTRTGKAQGPWSDIYALAATLYRAISGVSPQESPERQIDDELRPVAEVLEDPTRFRASFLEAIDQALALRYTDRPQTIAAWRPHLLGTRETATTLHPATPRSPAASALPKTDPPSSKRTPALVAAAIALVAVSMGGLWALNRPADPASQTTVSQRPATSPTSQSASQSASVPPSAAPGATTPAIPPASQAAAPPNAGSPPPPPASPPSNTTTTPDSAKQAQLADERQRPEKAAEDAAADARRRAAETQRIAAAEQAKRQADEQRAAEEARRRADAEAEARRVAIEAEARKKADEERRAAIEAEQRRAAEAARQVSSAKPIESTPQPPAAPPTLSPAAPPPQDVGQPEFARTLQTELRRVGCYLGVVDGDWGIASQKAFDDFVKFAKLDRTGKPDAGDLTAIQAKSARVCPAPVITCDADERLVNGQCVAKPKPIPPKQRETKPAYSSSNSQPRPQNQQPKSQPNCGAYIACTRLYRPGHGDIHCQRPSGC